MENSEMNFKINEPIIPNLKIYYTNNEFNYVSSKYIFEMAEKQKIPKELVENVIRSICKTNYIPVYVGYVMVQL